MLSIVGFGIYTETKSAEYNDLNGYNNLMWFVYILLCEDKSLYTGISNDPQKRLLDHRNGKGSRYTRLHKPIKIVSLEKLGSKSEALKRELQIKGWSRGNKISRLKLKI